MVKIKMMKIKKKKYIYYIVMFQKDKIKEKDLENKSNSKKRRKRRNNAIASYISNKTQNNSISPNIKNTMNYINYNNANRNIFINKYSIRNISKGQNKKFLIISIRYI